MKLKPRDEKIISALLSCGSISEAEKNAKVSRTTIYKRLADKEFRAEYDRRRAIILDEACAALQATLATAVNTIRQIIEDSENAPQVRLNACSMILQNCLKYVEQVEIIKELQRLEEVVKDYSKN